MVRNHAALRARAASSSRIGRQSPRKHPQIVRQDRVGDRTAHGCQNPSSADGGLKNQLPRDGYPGLRRPAPALQIHKALFLPCAAPTWRDRADRSHRRPSLLRAGGRSLWRQTRDPSRPLPRACPDRRRSAAQDFLSTAWVPTGGALAVEHPISEITVAVLTEQQRVCQIQPPFRPCPARSPVHRAHAR